MAMDKIEIARRQQGTALSLYLDDLDPVSIHSLAGNAREILDKLADYEGVSTFRDFALEASPGETPKNYYAAMNAYRNAFKHLEMDDRQIINSFSDEENKYLLFVCWFSYMNLCKRLPIEAQVFQIWCFAHVGEKFPEENYTSLGFDGLLQLTPSERKERLNAAIERARVDLDITGDVRTERLPLIYVNE